MKQDGLLQVCTALQLTNSNMLGFMFSLLLRLHPEKKEFLPSPTFFLGYFYFKFKDSLKQCFQLSMSSNVLCTLNFLEKRL